MEQPAESKKAAEEFGPFSVRLMTAIRAKETERDDRLFRDPFAAKLAGEERLSVLEKNLTQQDLAYIKVRTRFFDDFLLEICDREAQIVILASGMDTRAYRLAWSSRTKIYEIDRSFVLETKKSLLKDIAPTCQHYTIGADWHQAWSNLLLEQGYQPSLPSVWLLEGLLMYLDCSEVEQLLKTIFQLTNDESYLGLDLVRVKSRKEEADKGYFRFGEDDPEDLLIKHKWLPQVIEIGKTGADSNRYCDRLLSREVTDVERAFLIKAQRSKLRQSNQLLSVYI